MSSESGKSFIGISIFIFIVLAALGIIAFFKYLRV
jgi:hypothetical protein